MFSVIIPLYNKETYIEQSLKSVLNQTFREFELIIVNDGSTDKSLDVVKQINKSRNQQINIINQINSGVSVARNSGVKNSKYEYIAFLDADDWWHEDFLKEMSLLIEEYPDAVLYASNYYKVKNKKNIPAKIGINNNFKAGYINYFKVYSKTFWMPVHSSNTVLKKSAFKDCGGFNYSLKFAEDFDLWLKIALKYRIAFLNKRLSYYNQDVPDNKRALGRKLWKKEEHAVFNFDYLNKYEENNKELKNLLDGIRVRALIRYYLKGIYKTEVSNILSQINISEQPKFYQRIYTYPKILIKLYLKIKTIGSAIKKKLIKTKLKLTTYLH